MSESDYEYLGQNPEGKKYWRKRKKKREGEKKKMSQTEKKDNLANIPYVRGNYTADIIADEMEKNEQRRQELLEQEIERASRDKKI
jgi:hypothetical protein